MYLPANPTRNARPLRVALFSGNYNYTLDGANKSLNRLVGHLQTKLGAEVRVYSPTTAHPAFPPVGKLVSVPSVAIPLRPDYRFALGLPARIRRDIEAFEPDLIHLSAPDLLGAAALKLGRSLNLPVVASVHTLFDAYLEYYALGRLKPFFQRRLQAFYRACDYVLAPTQVMADELRPQVVPARVRVWGRGVDEALFKPDRRNLEWRRSQGFDDARPVIVFLGRIVMEKGLAVFAEAIARLEAATGPAQVLVIGEGPAGAWLRERLPRAVFTGHLSAEALATAVASGDILLNPSCTETFGNVNLEAMASGLAMVCADAPNTRSLITPGHSGILCAAADPAAFAQALQTLFAEPGLCGRLASGALAQSAAYRWPEILDQVVAVYAEALNPKRASQIVTPVVGPRLADDVDFAARARISDAEAA